MALTRTDLDKETFDAFELEFPDLSEQACVSVLASLSVHMGFEPDRLRARRILRLRARDGPLVVDGLGDVDRACELLVALFHLNAGTPARAAVAASPAVPAVPGVAAVEAADGVDAVAEVLAVPEVLAVEAITALPAVPGLDLPLFDEFMSSEGEAATHAHSFLDFFEKCSELVAASSLPAAAASGASSALDADALAQALNAQKDSTPYESDHKRVPDPEEALCNQLKSYLYSPIRQGSVNPPELPEQQSGVRHFAFALKMLGLTKAGEMKGLPFFKQPPDFYFEKVQGRYGLLVKGKLKESPPATQVSSLFQLTDAIEAVAIASLMPDALVIPPATPGGRFLSGGLSYAGFRTAVLRHILTLFPQDSATQLETLYVTLASCVEEWTVAREGDMDTRVWQPLTAAVKQLSLMRALSPVPPSVLGGAPPPKGTSVGAGPSGQAASGAIPSDGYPSKRAAKKAKKDLAKGVSTPGTGPYAGNKQQPRAPKAAAAAAAYPAHPGYGAYPPPPYYPSQYTYPNPQWPPPAAGPRPPPGPPPAMPAPVSGAPPGGAPLAAGAAPNRCFDWARGTCTRGAACKFAHA